MVQKFTQNCSISYHFRDIYTFYFSAKIQDDCHKWQKLKFFPFPWNTLVLPCGPQIHSKSLSYGFREIYTCLFSAKIQDGRQKWQKLKFFPFCIGYPYTTLSAQNSLKICLAVCEIFSIFYLPLKSKMATKSSKNLNFSFLHRIIFYYPLGQNFA